MPVKAVGADVQHPVLEPFYAEVRLVEGPVRYLGEWLDPVDPPAVFQPEGVGIAKRLPIHFRITRRIHLRTRGPFGRNWNHRLGTHQSLSFYPYPVRVTRAAARSAEPGRTIGRRRRTPVAAGKLRRIGDRAMLHAIRKAGVGGLREEEKIRITRKDERP